MPLFMDIHTVGDEPFSVEDVVKAHMEDLAIQDKFGVTQIKYWVNEEAQTIFCLMRGPDKESCHKVHQESHGNTACNIIEVSDNEYNLFMGVGTQVHDLAHTEKGDIDVGYRTLLGINSISTSNNVYKKKVFSLIEEQNGVVVPDASSGILVSFIYASEALKTALNVASYFQNRDDIEFSMALSTGDPVGEFSEQFFEDVKQRVIALSALGLNSLVYADANTVSLANKEQHVAALSTEALHIVEPNAIQLAEEVFAVLSANLTSTDFSSARLDSELGLSKSQSYRRLNALTGMSQNKLIQSFRLQQALDMLAARDRSVSEVAYDSGFSSPSYFTRSFKQRFGITPAQFVASQQSS